MNSDMPNRAGPHLVSGHPPSAPGARAPLQPRVAIVTGGTGVPAYTVSKVGVIALARALARELGPHGVTVNAVLPSTMDTPANRAAMPDSDRRGWVPVEAVADAIAMLAREQSAHITGTLLAV